MVFQVAWTSRTAQKCAGMDAITSYFQFWSVGFPGLCGRATFGCTRVVSRLGCKGHLPHSNGGNSSLPLFICVWTGVADGPQTGERPWELLCDLWRAVAPLFAPWCAEGELPTCANLNHYSGSGSCVRWHRDDEVLFGAQGESKLIVSVSIGYSAFFRWKPRSSPDCDADSSWLHHGDLLVMHGRCQDEYLHSTDPRSDGERVNITYRGSRTIYPSALGVHPSL